MKRLWHLVVIALVAVLGAFASPGVAGSGDGVTYVASDYSAAWPPPAFILFFWIRKECSFRDTTSTS